MSISAKSHLAIQHPFGTHFADKMTIMYYRDGYWTEPIIQDFQDLRLSPAAHVLHYSSTCFEGLKAYSTEGGIHIFRPRTHARRMQQSARSICLPLPDPDSLVAMIRALVNECREWVPDSPGSLYIRPTLIGTQPSIGSAAAPSDEACFYIILSPVGDYFKGGVKPLKLLLDDQHQRTTPEFGSAKSGANYILAMHHIAKAREVYNVDQVLFAPGGDVQETGAANFFLINDQEIVTRPLDSTFLHGVTRDSLLTLAADLGYRVSERPISPEEVLEWLVNGEAALSGTAAVLTGVGSIFYGDREHHARDGFGPNTRRLRDALLAIQQGKEPDTHGWLDRI